MNNLRKGKNVFRNAIDKVKGRKYKEQEEKTESAQRCNVLYYINNVFIILLM